MLTTTIFIGGSRSISEIPTAIQARFQRIVERGHEVVVGDAPGVDVLTQRCFVESGYQRVTVCHSGQRCRNNLGRWPTCSIEAGSRPGTAAFYTVKDEAMTEAASYGLMLWDGVSRGTLANTMRLLGQGKPLLLYFQPNQAAITMRSIADLGLLPKQA